MLVLTVLKTLAGGNAMSIRNAKPAGIEKGLTIQFRCESGHRLLDLAEVCELASSESHIKTFLTRPSAGPLDSEWSLNSDAFKAAYPDFGGRAAWMDGVIGVSLQSDGLCTRYFQALPDADHHLVGDK
jgi:hypothetical protein